MLYTDKTKQAMKLCFAAHRDQTDKSGMPYVFHPYHLAEQMEDETTTITALLHDVVEDTPYTLEDLREMGFPQASLDAIALMTHDEAVPYLAYVSKIRENPVARAVKLADLRHNSDLTRLDEVTPKALRRVRKYRMAMALLRLEDVEPLRAALPAAENLPEALSAYFAAHDEEDFGELLRGIGIEI